MICFIVYLDFNMLYITIAFESNHLKKYLLGTVSHNIYFLTIRSGIHTIILVIL